MPGKQQSVFILFLVICCCSFLLNTPAGTASEINKYYTQRLQELRAKLSVLENSCDKKQSLAALKENFLLARLSYKELTVLSEYFYRNESRLLNGPPLDRAEEDNPDKIIPPHGFQVIENYLFGTWQNKFYKLIETETVQMIVVLNSLEKRNDREFLFTDKLVWDALRSSLVRVTTLGITGYDSPLAALSIPEAAGSLKGIKGLLMIFKQHADEKTIPFYDTVFHLLDKSQVYLKENNNFNNFNRLDFITEFINPLYKQLIELRKISGIPVPEGDYPVNPDATTIFSDTSFNVNFFSPGKDYAITKERIQLGKKLFYDPVLSGTKDRSCASCHKPELAFTDGLKTALAIDQKTSLSRNTPSLLNSGLQSRLFYDSRADILENQLDEVVHNSEEMKGSFAKSTGDLKNDKEYHTLFAAAYSKEKEPVSAFNIANAISSYIRSLTSMNSRFDQYIAGDKTKLSAIEKNGFNLFMGKAKCATCHHPPLFNGLLPPDFIETESEVLGVPAATDTLHPKLDSDLGKYLFTQSAINKHSFKTPSLRNAELTAPYMHNGVYKTLKEVLDFYNKGGGKGLKIAPKNQTLPFDRLNLSEKEELDIISFMKSLTNTIHP